MGLDDLERVICLKNFTPASRRAGKGRQVKTQSAQEHAMNAIKIVADPAENIADLAVKNKSLTPKTSEFQFFAVFAFSFLF